MNICYSCGKELSLPDPVERKSFCPACKANVHCCRNCSFYDDTVPKQCRHQDTQWVSDHEKANFCEHFKMRDIENRENPSAKENAIRLFNNLFSE